MIGRAFSRFVRREPEVLILLYHRIATLQPDRWSIAVTPDHFAEHMDVLRSRTNVARLSDVDDILATPNAGRPTVIVTFDDGYADNLHNALPILAGYDVPATFFIATEAVLNHEEFWWDELERLVPDESFDVTWRELRDAEPHARAARMRSLRELTPLPPRDTHRVLRSDELRTLAAHPLVDIGGHTASHSRLAALTPAAQKAEVEAGKQALEPMVGKRVTSFAYPFGRSADYTAETMQIVREAAFSNACANQAGLTTRASDRFALPRLYVRDCDGDQFTKLLRDQGLHA